MCDDDSGSAGTPRRAGRATRGTAVRGARGRPNRARRGTVVRTARRPG